LSNKGTKEQRNKGTKEQNNNKILLLLTKYKIIILSYKQNNNHILLLQNIIK